MIQFPRKNLRTAIFAVILTFVALTGTRCSLKAIDQKKQAGDVLRRWSPAVITVKMVVTTRVVVAGREANRGESKSQATALVIDPSGLAVLPLSLTDPSRIANLFKNQGFGGEDVPDYNVTSQVTDLKMILDEGREVPGQVVLRDKDLDLAFIRPVDPLVRPVPAIDLSRSAVLEVMDELVFINRLGRVANRVPAVFTDTIQAKVTKPRTFYIPGYVGMEAGLGAPAFTFDGRFVGMVVLRILGGNMPMSPGLYYGLTSLEILPIIIPAEDILESAKQAPARGE